MAAEREPAVDFATRTDHEPGSASPARTWLSRLAAWSTRIRADLPWFVFDGLLTVGAYGGILVMRFDGSVPDRYWDRFLVFFPVAVLFHLLCNWAFRLYGQIWKHASVEEARLVVLAGMTAGAGLLVVVVADLAHIPRLVVVVGAVLTTVLTGATRFQSRLFALHRGGAGPSWQRVAIMGGGQAGAAIVRDLLRSPSTGLRAVAVFDDDPRKKGRSLLGVPILGGVDEFDALAPTLDIDQAWVAAPSAGPGFVNAVTTAAGRHNIPVRIVPALKDRVSLRDVREVRIEDLLGRKQVETDLGSVARVLNRRRVLITGAGGSIGSEIARQVSAFEAAHMVILDHDETLLHDAAVTAPGSVQVLADVRDADEMRQVFAEHRPDIVFHAAALKHVPVLEGHACQAVKTNVLGTANVATLAAEFGVEQLVFISSDKAVAPTSVMGASKSLGEQIVVDSAPPASRFCAVRFGNVLGSRGSVIPTFRRQIASGGPVTVCHPRMTRYFMSIQEAVQLVLQATALAQGGEIFILDMGQPVEILELAKRMIRLSGRSVGVELAEDGTIIGPADRVERRGPEDGMAPQDSIAIQYTGVRPGEKLSEELQAPWEEVQPTPHPSIQRLLPVKIPHETIVRTIECLKAQVRRGNGEAAASTMLILATDPALPSPLCGDVRGAAQQTRLLGREEMPAL